MSEENKHIDKLFKDKLGERSFDGPPADFIKDLNQRLDQKDKRSGGLIWFIFLNVLVVSLLIAKTTINYSPDATFENNIETKKSLNPKQDNNSLEKKDLEKINSSTEKKTVKNDNQIEQNRMHNENDETIKNKSDRYNDNSIVDNNKSVKESKNTISNLDQDSQTLKSVDTKEKDPNTGKKDAGVSTRDSEQNQSNEKSQNKSTNNSDLSTNERKSNQGSTSKSNEENAIKRENNKTNRELIASNYKPIYAADYENVDELFKSERIPTVLKSNSPLSKDSSLTQASEETSSSKKDPLKLELQLFGGASKWGFMTYSTNDGFKDKLDLNSKSFWSPTFGLNVNSYYKNITFGTGVSFLSIKEENNFESFNVSTYDSTYLAGYNENITYDTLGNPIDTTYTPYYDSTTVTDTTFKNSIIQNQYSWIQIPINIGYRFQLNKWAIIPRLGMNIGIGINNSDVSYPDENYDQIVAGPPVKWNLSLQPSLEIRRDFGNWHAYTRLDYRRNLTPAVEFNWFDRRYQGGMVRLGLGYTFEFERRK